MGYTTFANTGRPTHEYPWNEIRISSVTMVPFSPKINNDRLLFNYVSNMFADWYP